MKETHLQIGSEEVFKEKMKEYGIISEHTSAAPSFLGLKIILNENIPPEKAFLVDKNGTVIQVFSLTPLIESRK